MPNENRHELEAALADVHEQRERVLSELRKMEAEARDEVESYRVPAAAAKRRLAATRNLLRSESRRFDHLMQSLEQQLEDCSE
jgi:septation ring formation regulator EzrA